MSGKPPEIFSILDSLLYVGKMEFSSLHTSELKTGWYHANGDKYLLDSPQGVVLVSLSTKYKTDWSIVVSNNQINLPNWYYTDGRGCIPRAGVTPGAVQNDAIRNINGKFEMFFTAGTSYAYTGPFTRNPRDVYSGRTFQGANQSDLALYYEIDFDVSKSGVPTATENRPLNKALTPIVYLGV
jgi:hypothetical protein